MDTQCNSSIFFDLLTIFKFFISYNVFYDSFDLHAREGDMNNLFLCQINNMWWYIKYELKKFHGTCPPEEWENKRDKRLNKNE